MFLGQLCGHHQRHHVKAAATRAVEESADLADFFEGCALCVRSRIEKRPPPRRFRVARGGFDRPGTGAQLPRDVVIDARQFVGRQCVDAGGGLRAFKPQFVRCAGVGGKRRQKRRSGHLGELIGGRCGIRQCENAIVDQREGLAFLQ